MTDTLNSFEGGTDTTAISTANSGGTSGTAFDLANIPAGTTLAFSGTHVAHGGMAMYAAPGATTNSPHVRWSTAVGTLTQAWARAYIYLTAYPTVQTRLIEFRTGAAAVGATLRINTTGTLTAGGNSGTAITSTNTVPLNQWVRVEFMAIGSATAGQVEFKLFTSLDSATPTETQTSAATLNTSAAFADYRFGLPGTNGSGDAGVYMDDIAVSTTGYLGPAATGGSAGQVTVDASSPALSTSTTTATTCAAFNPPNDVVLVAAVFSSIAVSSETLTVTNNGVALTWTQLDFINSVVGKKGLTALYYAVLPGAHGRSGVTVTATVAGTGASGVGLKVYVLNGADTSSPAGGHTDGFNNLASFTTTGFTVARDGSMGFVVAEDNNGGTMSSSDTTAVVSTDTTSGRNGVVGYKALGSAGSSATFNVATTGTPANNWVSGEIKASLGTVYSGAASLAGSGSVTATASRTGVSAATLTGSGAVAAAGNQERTGAATLAGSGAVAATGVRPLTAAATLAATGAVAATGARTAVSAASLAGVGSLGALLNPPQQAAASFAAVGAVTAAATIPQQAAATLAGSGAVTAAAFRGLTAAATITGAGSVTAAGAVGPATRMTGDTSLTAGGSRIFGGSVVLAATSSLASRAVFTYFVPMALAPSVENPRITVGPSFPTVRAVARSVGFTPLRPVAGLPYVSGVQVIRDTGRYNAKVALVGSALLTVPGILTAAGAVTLVADAALSPTPSGAGKAILSATAALSARGVQLAKPALSMSATAALSLSGLPTAPGGITMAGGSSLAASGTAGVTYPHNMSAIVTSDNAIHLTWDAVPGATSYKLYEDQSLSGVAGATALTTTSSVRTPSTLRTYHYWVTANVGGVESPISNKATAILPYDPATANNGGSGGTTGGGTGGTATSFTMGFGSCINAADSIALSVCAGMNPDYFVQMGDVYYADGSSDAASHWDAQFGATGYAALLNALSAKGPLSQRHIYTWSDHEGFANNATASAFGPLNTAWRSYPQFSGVPVPASGIYNTFDIGRVKFIKLDERTFKSPNSATDDSNKTILGATQKAWFQNVIANATNALIVIIGDVPITTPTTAGDDAWSGYNTERLWMQGVLNGSPATFIRLSGNMHCLAKTSNTYGHDRAWQAAPLNNATKVSSGGTGLGASYPTNANEGATLQMFGMLTFTDNGSQITVDFAGYEATSTTAKTLRLSDTITVTAPAGTTGGGTGGTIGTPAQTLKINAVSGGTGGNWNEGIGFHSGDPEGATHQDISYSTLAGGYTRNPYFKTTADGTAVQFQVYCDGATTSSNTHYPRSELRELTSGGGSNMSFSGSSGTHKMSGSTRVMHGTSTKDEVVIAQIHDGADDTLQILVVGTSVFLSIKGTRQSSAVLTGLAKGTWFDWSIALTNGQLVILINGVQKYNSNPGYGAGQYFKVGCYAQAASGYTSGITAADYFTVELKNLVTSHA